MHRSRTSRADVTGRLAVVLIGSMCALTGCSTGGGLSGSLSAAVDQSYSAVATSRLALSQESRDKLTKAATATTLSDMLQKTVDAEKSVLELSPTVQDERALRDEALAAIGESLAGVVRAQDAIGSSDGTPSTGRGMAGLNAAADKLLALKQRAGGQR